MSHLDTLLCKGVFLISPCILFDVYGTDPNPKIFKVTLKHVVSYNKPKINPSGWRT